MGKYKGKNQRTMKRDFKHSRPDRWAQNSRSQLERSEYNNELFVEYYQKQGVVPEGQWDEFMEVLKSPLPTTFRINGTGKFATDLRDKLESDFLSNFNKDPIMVAGETLQPPRPLPWYSNKLAWHMSFSRGQLRKLPILAEIHELLKRENEAGSITRQEAVSMVPPLFLDVEPHHRILDMCAAPGSKTAQILEMLHAGTMMPTGIVVANDADAQRCNLLAHQTKRMCSPALIVTNHDATMYPIVIDHAAKEALLFDRILCDVPCSGDGTIRKAPDIWRRWTPGNGNGLHPLQLRIALHACQMLKVGGRLVYSTCTFNPIEDEAVVAEVLRVTGGAMKLLDLSDHLPGLPRLPGLKKWYARDKVQYYETWEEASENKPHKLSKSMFPNADAASLPLERCMRILPHHSDTGGFFIAVLEKVDKYPQPKQEPAAAAGTKRPRSQETAEPLDGTNSTADAPAALATADAALSESADTAAVAAAIAATDRADAVLHNGAHEAVKPEEQPNTVAQVSAAVKAEPAEASTADVQNSGTPGTTADGLAAAAPVNGEPSKTVDAGEGPAAKRAKHTDMAESEAANAPVIFPTPTPTPAAAEPSVAQDRKSAPKWGVRGGGGRNRGLGGRFKGLDPVVPVTDPEILSSISEFYGIAQGFPLWGQIITRSLEPGRPKRLYYVSSGVKHLLQNDDREALKVTMTGLKVFERQELKDGEQMCRYRIVQDGLPLLLPYVTRQLLQPTVQELLHLIEDRSLYVPEEARAVLADAAADQQPGVEVKGEPMEQVAADSGAAADSGVAAGSEVTAELEVKTGEAEDKQANAEGDLTGAAEAQKQRYSPEDPDTLEQIRNLKHGCCIVMLREAEAASLGLDTSKQTKDALSVHAPLAVAAWKGKGSINILVSKGECAQIAERLRKAIGKAAEGKPLQGQAAAVLGQQAASAPGYEGDVEMQ